MEHDKNKKNDQELETESADWQADDSDETTTLDMSALRSKTMGESASQPDVVGILTDPFGLANIQEVSDAQRSDEELVLDEGIDDFPEVNELDDSALKNLASAMAVEHEKHVAELEALASEAHEETAETEDSPEMEEVPSEEEEASDAELAAALPQPDENGKLDVAEVESCIETLLFMMDKPVSLEKLYNMLTAEAQPTKAILPRESELRSRASKEVKVAKPKAPKKKAKTALEGEQVEGAEAAQAQAAAPAEDQEPAVAESKAESTKEKHDPGYYALFQEALTHLRNRYKATHHGIEIAEVGGGIQFRTKPGRAALAKRLSKVQVQRLSSGAMESIAIIAYKQPVLKEDIDKVRGVDSSYFVRQLLDRNLIKIDGRSELPGRPLLYSTTQHFLELFGLKDLSALPPLSELESMVPTSQSANPDDENYGDPRVREMRRLVAEMKSDKTRIAYDPKEDERILQEIRERVGSISTSTPFIEEQKAAEKAAAEAAKQGRMQNGWADALDEKPGQQELAIDAAAEQAQFTPPPADESESTDGTEAAQE